MMKKTVALFMTVLMVFSLAACGSGSDGKGDSKKEGDEKGGDSEIVLEFQQWFDNEMEEGYLQSICDDFYEETGIKIKLLSNPYADTKTQLEASAAAGTMADIVALDGGWIYDYAKQGLLAKLDGLYEDTGFDAKSVAEGTKVDKALYAQPIVNFPSMMAVNLDLLKSAGVDTLPETWSEFQEACEKVTDSGDNVYGFCSNMSTDNATSVEYLTAFAWNSGCSILTDDGKPFIADNEVLADTCEFLKGLIDAKVTSPGIYTMTDADKVEEFTNGRVAFIADSVAHMSNIREQAPDMNFTYMNMPHKDDYSGDSYVRVNNWAVGIGENCKYKEEAAKFIEYLLSPEVNADLCIHANAFPANSEAEPQYEDDSDAFKAIYDVYMNSNGVAEYYSMPTAEALMSAFIDGLVMYFDGDYDDVNNMLSEVQTQFDAAYE
ncbi:ABC transporter substrate-binding protein [[Clostridium] hylemonae]|uniref:ABC transporter substrate-binding protein n=1 Tax=[Clostridium] hylemonae TaxID=89153 RepID=UPI001FCB812C|nr:sugar ABC transporter substrate-binding protein [[Clostridium] hylemonae]BDF05420.1 hypothetical protein CE91St63_24820 [[Clostridium] hylemonae]